MRQLSAIVAFYWGRRWPVHLNHFNFTRNLQLIRRKGQIFLEKLSPLFHFSLCAFFATLFLDFHYFRFVCRCRRRPDSIWLYAFACTQNPHMHSVKWEKAQPYTTTTTRTYIGKQQPQMATQWKRASESIQSLCDLRSFSLCCCYNRIAAVAAFGLRGCDR